uniref:Uncharacterized protein n=1 Tax=Globodera rostochiensis TaxID=31243 RepID=A0A914HT30_GLORO
MAKFWILILVAFFATNSLDKAESVKVKLEETPLKTVDEIFVDEWWDNDKADEWDKITLEQNVLHQIDRQNTQIGQIGPDSTDQNPPLTESDHFGQIEPNSTDQNPPPLTEWKQKLGQTKPQHKYSQNEQKELMKRYYEIKDKNTKISDKDIAKRLKIGKNTLYRWKKQFKRQQFHPNSVDGHSVEVNAAANVQEIGNSNSGAI